MLIGIGCTVPEIVNLPGQSGGEEAALDYSLASACNNNSAFSPSQATPSGGVFSATPSGLNINSSTGEVTPVGSTPQAYVIAYTVGGSTSSFDLTIKPLDNATFSYSASSFPQDASNPSPVFPSGAITGGTFSGTTGLVINSTTGEIDLSASTVASHTVTYNTGSSGSSVCPNTSTFTVAITAVIPALAQINNVYSMEFDGAFTKINLPSTQISTGDISISFWLKSSDLSSRYNNITGSGGANGYNNIFTYLSLKSGKIATASPAGTFPNSSFLTDVVADGNWNHICLSYVKLAGPLTPQVGVIKSYVNGQLQYSLDLPSNMVWSNNTITTIGDYSQTGLSPTRALLGSLDEIGLWNVALTGAEALSIYNATEVVGGVNKTADLSQLTTPPVKWYRMGD